MLQKFFFFLLVLTIFQFDQVFCPKSINCKKGNSIQNKIKQFNTIYSLSKIHSVTIDDIYRSNFFLKNCIKIGSQLEILKNSNLFFLHTIIPKETICSISKMYQIEEKNILKIYPGLSIEPVTFGRGKIIFIPSDMSAKNNTDELIKKRILNVVLLLPFGLKGGTCKSMVCKSALEYYEGLLIALKHIKKIGISVSLHAFDIGSGVELLRDIFENSLTKNVDLIIGGLTKKQIELISIFSDKYNIPYVTPFYSGNNDSLFYTNIFQINMSQSHLDDKISSVFCDKYNDANIVFYVPNSFGNRMNFINVVQKKLQIKKITYKVITSEDLIYSDIVAMLDNSKKNIIVLFDDSKNVLTKTFSILKKIKDIDSHFFISIFGYPNWQNYSIEHSDDFFNFNVVFYSVFYANPISQEVQSFCNNYRYWFSKKMINYYPKYEMLGYDATMFFIQLLDKYGTLFPKNINTLEYFGVQSNFFFKKIDDCCGFINTCFFLIKFDENFIINCDLFK